MLYLDSPDHADDAGALGLLIRRLEAKISAIFISFGWWWKMDKTDGLRNLMMSQFALLDTEKIF